MTSLTYDTWSATNVESTHIEDPSWEEIEAAIHLLDGSIVTDVTISRPGDSSFTLGGGLCGQYVLYADYETKEGLRNYRLIDRDKSSSITVELVVGGQGIDYPLSHVTDLATVLGAARRYFETGELDLHLPWVLRQRITRKSTWNPDPSPPW